MKCNVECCEDVTKLSLCTVRYARTAFRVSDTMVTLWCNHICHLSYKVPCLAAQGQRWLSRMLGYDRYRQYLARGCFVALCKNPKPSVILVIGRDLRSNCSSWPGRTESEMCAPHQNVERLPKPNQTSSFSWDPPAESAGRRPTITPRARGSLLVAGPEDAGSQNRSISTPFRTAWPAESSAFWTSAA